MRTCVHVCESNQLCLRAYDVCVSVLSCADMRAYSNLCVQMEDVNWHVEFTREVFTDNYVEMCREKENTTAYTELGSHSLIYPGSQTQQKKLHPIFLSPL